MTSRRGNGKTNRVRGRQGAGAPISAEVELLAGLLERHGLSEIEVEQPAWRIRVRRGAPSEVAVERPTERTVAPTPASKVATGKAETSDGSVSYISSPFVGTFYRSPGPDAAPFVEEGTRVKKGQVLCIVEAMKLMNEIESEVNGEILACLVENNHPVEYGEPLFKIKQD